MKIGSHGLFQIQVTNYCEKTVQVGGRSRRPSETYKPRNMVSSYSCYGYNVTAYSYYRLPRVIEWACCIDIFVWILTVNRHSVLTWASLVL
jgi:hypothetical protein